MELRSAVGRHPAHAEALDDQRVVVLQHPGQQCAVRARDHFQQGDLLVHPVVEDGPLPALRHDEGQNPSVADIGQLRIVDAGKGAEALGVRLSGAGTQHDLPVEDQQDPAKIRAGAAEGVLQVHLGVRAV